LRRWWESGKTVKPVKAHFISATSRWVIRIHENKANAMVGEATKKEFHVVVVFVVDKLGG